MKIQRKHGNQEWVIGTVERIDTTKTPAEIDQVKLNGYTITSWTWKELRCSTDNDTYKTWWKTFRKDERCARRTGTAEPLDMWGNLLEHFDKKTFKNMIKKAQYWYKRSGIKDEMYPALAKAIEASE